MLAELIRLDALMRLDTRCTTSNPQAGLMLGSCSCMRCLAGGTIVKDLVPTTFAPQSDVLIEVEFPFEVPKAQSIKDRH
jgi:hypothetical protein